MTLIHNTSIVSRYDFIGDIPKDFPDTVIRNQNSSKCDTLIVYGRNERADTLEKLDVLSKHFRYALFIDDNAANIKTRFPIPVHTNILNLDVIDNPILLNDELDTQFDIPVIKCLISKEHDLLFEHLEVLFDIVSVFREKGYNCTVLTNLDIGLLFGFIVQRNNISLTMINKLIKFHNIDLLLVAICEEDCIMKNFLFDLTFKFAQNNFDASNYIELIENAFE